MPKWELYEFAKEDVSLTFKIKDEKQRSILLELLKEAVIEISADMEKES